MKLINYTNLWQNWIDEILKVVPRENEYFNLKAGVSDTDIKKHEKLLGFPFPEELAAFYMANDVVYDPLTSVFSFNTFDLSYNLLPFKMIVNKRRDSLSLNFDADEIRSNYDDAKISDAIKSTAYADSGWIPFADGGNGDYLLFDTNPSEKGLFGQIIELQNETWERNIIAISLEELIQLQITKLQNESQKIYEFVLAPEETYIHLSKEQIDANKLKEALELEDSYREINGNPSPDVLFEWAKSMFRHKGDPQYGEPNLHIMKLSKKYFDQISPKVLSSKQARELAFFNQRYKQFISSD